MRQLLWVDPDVATAVRVAVNVLLLSDGVPNTTVTRQRGPIVDTDAWVAKISSKAVAIIEL